MHAMSVEGLLQRLCRDGRKFCFAECCKNKNCEYNDKFFDSPCKLKGRLIEEFDLHGIGDMEEVAELHALEGSYINLEYSERSDRKTAARR